MGMPVSFNPPTWLIFLVFRLQIMYNLSSASFASEMGFVLLTADSTAGGMPDAEEWRVAFDRAGSSRSSYSSSPSRSSRAPSPSMNGRPSSRNSNYSDGDENVDVGSSRRIPGRRAPPPPPPPGASSMYRY